MLNKVVPMVAVVALAASTAFAGQAQRKDLQIFKDVSNQVNRYSQFTVFDDVNAAIDQGTITLTGHVTMPYKRDEIEKRVARVDGVRGVVNRLEVLPVSIGDDELRFRIARAIYGNSNFWGYASMVSPPIHIVVDHGHVTLTGVVMTNVDRMIAQSLATTWGAFSVTNNLKTEAEARIALEKVS